jgi:nicotinic acid mononucleotide adenylyltransferase
LDDLFTHMELIIGVRQGDDRKQLKRLLRSLGTKVKPRYIFVDSPWADASSTRVRQGHAVRDISPEVSSYIESHNLYKKQ